MEQDSLSKRFDGFRAMRALVVLFNLVIGAVVGTLVYWQWFDRVLPAIDVAHSEIKFYPPPTPGAPRVYGVTRRMHISGDFRGTIHPAFVRPDTDHVAELDGKPVMRDGTSHTLTPVQASWTKGWHIRERLWEVPAAMPAGAYEYRVHLEACNPLRCERFHFRPLPIRVE